MNRVVVGFLLLGYVCVLLVFANAGLSVRSPCGVDCGLQVVGDPILLIGGASLALFIFNYKQVAPKPQPSRPVHIWRRLMAFLVDVFVAVFMIMVPVVSLLLFSQYVLTGNWAWSFQLAPSQISSLIGFASMVCLLAMLHAYFWFHSAMHRPTVGQYIMGFQITGDGENPRFRWSPIIAFVALCSVHFWIWFKKREDSERGWYWWDRAAGTRAVMTTP